MPFGTSTKCVDYAGVLIFKCSHQQISLQLVARFRLQYLSDQIPTGTLSRVFVSVSVCIRHGAKDFQVLIKYTSSRIQKITEVRASTIKCVLKGTRTI